MKHDNCLFFIQPVRVRFKIKHSFVVTEALQTTCISFFLCILSFCLATFWAQSLSTSRALISVWSDITYPRAVLYPELPFFASRMPDLLPSLLMPSRLEKKKGQVIVLLTCSTHPCPAPLPSPPPTRACHSAQPCGHILNFCHYFCFFTKHCRDGTGVQIWTHCKSS